MSVSLLRQARVSQSLSVACRAASRCRYSVATVVPRHESENTDTTPVAGPSHSDASGSPSSNNSRTLAPTSGQDQDSENAEPFSRVRSYLATINASGKEPTLQDLEHCKPRNRPAVHSPQYAMAYNDTIGTLCRSFTKEQLRKFLREALGTNRHCATNRKKVDYAESILEQLWKWPKLSDLERAKRDRTEVVTKMFPVESHELFLLLGRDGADLLRMSQNYDVHISLRQKPLALRLEGTRIAVRELMEHMLTLRKSFTEETLDLPSHRPIPPDMVQRISRLAQAYLEDIKSSPGKARICAKNAEALEIAKRLAVRAVHEIEDGLRAPMLTHLPAGSSAHSAEPLVMYPHSYALYPHHSPRALPTYVNTSGAFRLRRVGEWLNSDCEQNSEEKEGLAGHFLTASEQLVDLKEALLQALPEGVQSANTVIKASLGHMLLTRISKDQRPTIVSPLAGQHSFGKIRSWITNNPVKMSFVPDLPLPLLNTSPAHQKMIHRIVYHSYSLGSEDGGGEGDSVPVRTHRRKVVSLEVTLSDDHSKSDAVQRILDDLQSPDEDLMSQSSEGEWPSDPSIPTFAGAQCWTGVQADVNVMMPDRPMDLQFTVSNSVALSESQQPAELRKYIEQLREFLSGSESQSEQPTPPLTLKLDGTQYLLRTNVSVKQSEEVVIPPSKPADWDQPEGAQATSETEYPTHALCESVLDLESNQKTVHCEVAATNIASDQSWKQFLTDCDRLSGMHNRSTNNTSFMTGAQDAIEYASV